MYISANLKRLRRERDLTQEKLAEIIGVVPQAVSKWERGEGLPDITLIPSIAAAFNVTTDELFGMDEELNQKRVKEILAELGQIGWEQDGSYNPEEGIAYLRRQLREHPKEWELWNVLSITLSRSASSFGTKEYNEKNTREAIDIWERIADQCPDMRIRSSAIPMIVTTYSHIGEYDKAKEYAKLLPHKAYSYEHTAPNFLKGQELREFLETDIADTIWYLSFLTQYAAGMVIYQSEKYHDYVNSEAGYTLEERLEWLDFGISILELMKGKAWGGIWAQECCKNCQIAAHMLLKNGDTDSALSYLEKAAIYCEPIENEKKAKITLNPNMKYNGEAEIIPTKNARRRVLEILQDSCKIEEGAFYTLRNEPRYKALIKKMDV